jgi:hypothetical protein
LESANKLTAPNPTLSIFHPDNPSKCLADKLYFYKKKVLWIQPWRSLATIARIFPFSPKIKRITSYKTIIRKKMKTIQSVMAQQVGPQAIVFTGLLRDLKPVISVGIMTSLSIMKIK